MERKMLCVEQVHWKERVGMDMTIENRSNRVFLSSFHGVLSMNTFLWYYDAH